MYCFFSFLLYFTCIFLFARQVLTQIIFVHPPPNGPSHNYQDNPIYKYGSSILVEWTGDMPDNVNSLHLEAWRDLSDGSGIYLGEEDAAL